MCNCKYFCQSSLYSALRHARKCQLYFDDEDCNPNNCILDDRDISWLVEVIEAAFENKNEPIS